MSAITIRVRVDQDGDVFRIVHEDSGKTLCSGCWDDVKHWVDNDPRKTLSEFLIATAA